MTGQINVNKIAARTGTTITIDTGDALDVTLVKAEGSATTNLKQGLCKQWSNIDGTGTLAVDDSFNVSGVTDQAAGTYLIAFTNGMSNANFAPVMATEIPSNAANNAYRVHSLTTSNYGVQFYQAASPTDVDPLTTICTGNLA